MMTQFVMDTDRINFIATAPVKVGDIVEVGKLHGVAITDIAKGEVGAVKVTGVFKVAANKADTYAVGDLVQFLTDKAVKTGGKVLGMAVEPKTATQETVTVMLLQPTA